MRLHRMTTNATYTLPNSRLVDLNGMNAGLLEVDNLITKSKSKLLRLQFSGDVGAGEGPVEDGDGAGQHSLHGLLGDALSIATPSDGHGTFTVDVGDDDRGTNISKEDYGQYLIRAIRCRNEYLPRTVTLDPSILSEDKSNELFTKVLNHVVSLRFTMDKEIEADFLLESNDAFDFLRDELVVFLLCDFTLCEFRTGLSDFLGLLLKQQKIRLRSLWHKRERTNGEGADGGGREFRELQMLLLSLPTNGECALAFEIRIGDGSNPLPNLVVRVLFEIASFLDRFPIFFQRFGDLGFLRSAESLGENVDFAGFLEGEGEPIFLFGGEFVFGGECYWAVE
jgi:hypothetical protein